MAQEQTPAQVAKTATTQSNATLDGLILLGTFGSNAAPRAMVRTSKGETVTLKIGDRIGRNPIVAIEDGRLAYAKGGAMQWLRQPVN
ncbi:amidophosphoribosyltransferase [Sagittula sp. SSi028]|uniref:amidophosphoribosyltransferase n=1 Tax=Sagittula sp. SSi028 TaxID=3400636 RepID=UPI003AF9D37B